MTVRKASPDVAELTVGNRPLPLLTAVTSPMFVNVTVPVAEETGLPLMSTSVAVRVLGRFEGSAELSPVIVIPPIWLDASTLTLSGEVPVSVGGFDASSCTLPALKPVTVKKAKPVLENVASALSPVTEPTPTMPTRASVAVRPLVPVTVFPAAS